jgi:hypothetical protein
MVIPWEKVYHDRVSRAATPAYSLLCDQVDGCKVGHTLSNREDREYSKLSINKYCDNLATMLVSPLSKDHIAHDRRKQQCRSRSPRLTHRTQPLNVLLLASVILSQRAQTCLCRKKSTRLANLAQIDTKTEWECGSRSQDPVHVSVGFTTIAAVYLLHETRLMKPEFVQSTYQCASLMPNFSVASVEAHLTRLHSFTSLLQDSVVRRF